MRPGRPIRAAVTAAAVLTLSGCGSASSTVSSDATAEGRTAAPSVTPCVVPSPVEPPPKTQSDFSLQERQAITNQELIHDHIDPVVHPYRERADNGYAQVRVDVQAASAKILWKGEPPADVQGLVGTSPNCVRVELVDVPYSRADLERAYQGVIRAQNLGELPGFSGLGPSRTFDALEVGFPSAELDANNNDANRASFEATASMPVRFVAIGGTADMGVGRVAKSD